LSEIVPILPLCTLQSKYVTVGYVLGNEFTCASMYVTKLLVGLD